VRMTNSGFEAKKGNPIAAFPVPLLRRNFSLRIFSAPLLFVAQIGLTLAALRPVAAQGGPPFITNDPGTPGDGNWEVNIMTYSEGHPATRIFNAPILDLNYRVGSRIQLTYEVPYLVEGTTAVRRARVSASHCRA
jgi:hypothetical protein